MKKLSLLLSLCILAFLGYTQEASITVSTNAVCLGDTVYASVTPPLLSLEGTTGSNRQNGVMFDITATANFRIEDFLINNNIATTDIEVYTRLGSHVGYETDSTAWTLLATSYSVPVGTDIPLDLGLALSVTKGQTRAFYITATSSPHFIAYSNSTNPVGSVVNSNYYFQIQVGAGKTYPFGSTFTPRAFIGEVVFTPEVTATVWNTGDTTTSIAYVPQRSTVLSASILLADNYVSTSQGEAVIVSEFDVTAEADPYHILPGDTSSLTGSVVLRLGAGTTMEAGNSQSGAMFDLATTLPVIINGFTVNFTNLGSGEVEVFYKTGSHIGFEGDSTAWTSLEVFQHLSGGFGSHLMFTTPLSIAANQTVAFYITTTDEQRLYYTNGSSLGQTAASGPGIEIKEGRGIAYPFGTVFSPRILNTIVLYELVNPPGTTFSWDNGASGDSVTATPGITTTYTLTVTHLGCSAQDTVQVTVAGTGINEIEPAALKIYPNPATDHLIVESKEKNTMTWFYLTDIQGKTVTAPIIPANNHRLQIPVSHLNPGIYLLHVEHDTQKASYRIVISR